MTPIEPRIIDRGRGPEIAGTRITVYDIMDYYRHGDHHTYIASMLGLSSAEVLCAVKYIEEHREEVQADYEQILARHAKGNPPEVQAKLEECHRRMLAKMEELRRKKESGRARTAG
jgi:uncharacterized protein (DUF433 family)